MTAVSFGTVISAGNVGEHFVNTSAARGITRALDLIFDLENDNL